MRTTFQALGNQSAINSFRLPIQSIIMKTTSSCWGGRSKKHVQWKQNACGCADEPATTEPVPKDTTKTSRKDGTKSLKSGEEEGKSR